MTPEPNPVARLVRGGRRARSGEHRRRCALLAKCVSLSLSQLLNGEASMLDALADAVLTRHGYTYRDPGEWRVRHRYLPMWPALRAHVERMRAIEARLVAELQWHERRVAA